MVKWCISQRQELQSTEIVANGTHVWAVQEDNECTSFFTNCQDFGNISSLRFWLKNESMAYLWKSGIYRAGNSFLNDWLDIFEKVLHWNRYIYFKDWVEDICIKSGSVEP